MIFIKWMDNIGTNYITINQNIVSISNIYPIIRADITIIKYTSVKIPTNSITPIKISYNTILYTQARLHSIFKHTITQYVRIRSNTEPMPIITSKLYHITRLTISNEFSTRRNTNTIVNCQLRARFNL